MKVKIVSFKKGDEKRILSLENEYIYRLKKHIKIDLIDLKSKKVKYDDVFGLEDIKKVEKSLSKDDLLVLLTEHGKEYNSIELADFINKKINNKVKAITFIIAGPNGFKEEVLKSKYLKLSLSRLTFPHKLVRLLLLEAIYRTFDILNNGKYHK